MLNSLKPPAGKSITEIILLAEGKAGENDGLLYGILVALKPGLLEGLLPVKFIEFNTQSELASLVISKLIHSGSLRVSILSTLIDALNKPFN